VTKAGKKESELLQEMMRYKYCRYVKDIDKGIFFLSVNVKQLSKSKQRRSKAISATGRGGL
jgi:hypothetical protein